MDQNRRAKFEMLLSAMTFSTETEKAVEECLIKIESARTVFEQHTSAARHGAGQTAKEALVDRVMDAIRP